MKTRLHIVLGQQQCSTWQWMALLQAMSSLLEMLPRFIVAASALKAPASTHQAPPLSQQLEFQIFLSPQL
jgi:hypothetical protein